MGVIQFRFITISFYDRWFIFVAGEPEKYQEEAFPSQIIHCLELNGKLGGVESVFGQSEVDENFLSVNKFLCDHTRKSEHGKTSILEFFGVELKEFAFVLGGQAKRVETNITGEVIFLEDAVSSEDITRGIPSDEGSVELKSSDDKGQDLEKGGRDGTDLVKMTDGGSNILVISLEERVEFDGFLGDEEADGSEHGNTSVLKLGLAVLFDSFEVFALGKSKRIEVSDGFKCAGEAVCKGIGIRGEGGCYFVSA